MNDRTGQIWESHSWSSTPWRMVVLVTSSDATGFEHTGVVLDNENGWAQQGTVVKSTELHPGDWEQSGFHKRIV